MSSVANIAKAVDIWMVRCDTAGSFPEQRSQDSERLVMLQYTWVEDVIQDERVRPE